jgi:hypothetical protein
MAGQFMPIINFPGEKPFAITVRPVIDLKIRYRLGKIFSLLPFLKLSKMIGKIYPKFRPFSSH